MLMVQQLQSYPTHHFATVHSLDVIHWIVVQGMWCSDGVGCSRVVRRDRREIVWVVERRIDAGAQFDTKTVIGRNKDKVC